ncbi:MAG: nucleotide exchange factor GrpE [bacterium]|nr:nucleotide exchange factor GrpE [Candidatus Minthenecus merdequi]
MKHNKQQDKPTDTEKEEKNPQSETEQQPAEEPTDKNDNRDTENADNKSEVDWQTKCTEINDAHLRLMADFDNYRKRTIKEKADLIKNASERIITDFLPIIDNLERALASMEKAENVKAIADGVNLIYTQIMTMLQSNGVSVIPTENLPLDTDVHDAITTIPAPTPELKGKIVDCVKKGYKLNDKVIRHSQVVVGE